MRRMAFLHMTFVLVPIGGFDVDFERDGRTAVLMCHAEEHGGHIGAFGLFLNEKRGLDRSCDH